MSEQIIESAILTTGEFVDAPPPNAQGRKASEEWKKVAADLAANPGLWRKVAENVNPSLAHRIKSGDMSAFVASDGTYEAVNRNTDPTTKRCDVWARFMP